MFLAFVACGSPAARAPAPPSPATPPDLGPHVVALDRFARRELFSWTSGSTAARLAAEGPPLLRVPIHRRAPDVSFYDVHLRATEDLALRTLLTAAPFDKTRYAWPNPWGAALGVEDERYGDRLIRVLLRADAVVARFLPREGAGAAIDGPEWAFQAVDGSAVSRDDVLAHPARLAAILHVRSAWAGKTFVGYREYVLVQEAAIERFELGTPAVRAALSNGAALIEQLRRSAAVPRTRSNDALFLESVVAVGWPHGEAASPEAAWFLTLPFPRSRFRDLGTLRSTLLRAQIAQRTEATFTAEP